MATDPVAVSEYARVNEGAALALESIVFPTIGSWHGVAGKVFQARVAALAKRRNELKDAHSRAASALRSFAVVADQTQQEMRFRQSQRADAVDRRSHLEARSHYTTDPVELRQLQHERDACERDIRNADKAYAKADKTFQEAEKKCAHDIEHLANLAAIQPLAERIEKLSLADFVAYKSLVKTNVISGEDLNWTADGCSDHGIVTGDVDLAPCQLHDFDYRNNDKTRDPYLIDKVKADSRLAKEIVRNAPATDFLANPFVSGMPTALLRSAVVFGGVAVGGWPDANMKDDREKKEKKSRDK